MTDQCQPMSADPMDDLVYRLRYPAYSWSEAFGSNLDKEETIADMSEAADEITTLTSRAEQDAKRIEELEKALQKTRGAIDMYGLDDFESTTEAVLKEIDAALQRGGA